MSVSAADGAHEFVAAPELAEVAERLGVPLHAGDRARFEVIDREREAAPHRRRLGWLGSVSTGEHTLSERAEDVQLGTSGGSRPVQTANWASAAPDFLHDV